MASRDPAQRRQIAALGGLARSARESPEQMLNAANRTWRDSFLTGHGCAMCKRIDIPQDLPRAEIERRAKQLYKLHMRHIRLRRNKAEHQAADAAAELQTCDELADSARAS